MIRAYIQKNSDKNKDNIKVFLNRDKNKKSKKYYFFNKRYI